MLTELLFYSYVAIISLFAIFSTYLGFAQYKPGPVSARYKPKTLVIVPCKGVDLTLEDNLMSIAGQDYENCDVVAVVDNGRDAAMPYIRKAGIRCITTSAKFKRGSGKVNAVSTALSRFKDYDAYVIADSDILVRPDWLGLLVAPLGNKRNGLSTAFPYFKPQEGFWSKVKLVWGFVGQGMMESDTLRFGWGGSLAFRKDLLDKASFDSFTRSLSDDIAITQTVKRKGLSLFYVKDAQPVVNTKDTFATFFEWANRQTAFSIRGNRNVFGFGMLSYALQILLLASAILLSLFYSPVALLLFVPVLLGIAKAHSRLKEPMPGFVPLYLAMPFVFLANLIIARRMQGIEWRGRKYTF